MSTTTFNHQIGQFTLTDWAGNLVSRAFIYIAHADGKEKRTGALMESPRAEQVMDIPAPDGFDIKAKTHRGLNVNLVLTGGIRVSMQGVFNISLDMISGLIWFERADGLLEPPYPLSQVLQIHSWETKV